MGIQKKILISFLILFTSLVAGSTTSGGLGYGDINMIDEGQFGAWANHMLHGKLMFKDIYIVYGPLHVYPLYLLFKIFEPSAFLARFYLSLGGAVGIVAVYFLLLHLKIRRSVRLIALLLFFAIPIMNLRVSFALWTLYFLFRANKKRSNFIANLIVGVLAATTFLISQDFGTFIFLILFVHIIYVFITSKSKEFLKSFSAIALGSGSLMLLFFTWFYLEGWLLSYLDTLLDVSTSLAGINVPNGKNFPYPHTFLSLDIGNLLKSLSSEDILIYGNLVIILSGIFYSIVNAFRLKLKNTNYEALLVGFLALFSFMVLLTRSGIGHYFYTMPPIIILCAFFADSLSKEKKINRHLSTIIITVLVIFALRVVYLNNPNILSAFSPSTYLKRHEPSISRIGPLNISEFQEKKIVLMQSLIRRFTQKGDSVFFFNDQPMMYLLTDRVNPTKFDLPFAANTLDKRLNLLQSLISQKPKIIIFDKDVWAIDGITNIRRLPEVYSYILVSYSLSLEKDNVLIYTLKENE